MKLPLATLLLSAALLPPQLTSAAPSPTSYYTDTFPQPGAPNLGDTVQPSLGNGGYEVRRYALDVRVSSDLKNFTSVSTIQARTTQALSQFNLDLLDTTVKSVMVNDQPARWVRVGEELQIRPPLTLRRKANFTVRVTVQGEIPDREGARRLQTLAYGLIRAGDWLQTVPQPSGAHRIAALADHPSQKAPATITIVAPSHLNSISNGELVGEWRDPVDPAFTVRRFETGWKIAPELLQIGVGPFTIVRSAGPHGIKLRSVLPTDQLATMKPQLATIPEAISFLEARLGPFPLRTYGIYVTPLGGDLETQSLAIFSFRELTPEGFRARDESRVVAHEISHEYFGNSVSPRRWSDVWLNEGHAQFYEYLWVEAHGGRKLDDTMRLIYARENQLVGRYGPVANPRRASFPDPYLAPFSGLIYQGGSLALYALRQEVGTATFEKIERAWVTEHRNSVADTSDYIALASRIAGRDLTAFMRPWLYEEKVPSMPGHSDWTVAPAAETPARPERQVSVSD